MEGEVPPPPKLTRSRSRAPPKVEEEPKPYTYHPAPKVRKPRGVVMDDTPPAVQEFTPDPGEKKPRRRKAPEPPPDFEYEEPPPKPKRVRKKPEPGTVPPKEISFNSARGPINFTAHKAYEVPYHEPEPMAPRSRYGHLHGNRWTELLNQW